MTHSRPLESTAARFRWIRDIGQDVRYALRTLRKNPAFSAAALLTLTLGIGATSTVFSVVYGVLLRPLPFPSSDRLVRVWEEHPGGTAVGGNRWISNRTYWAWTEQPRTIDVLGAYGEYPASIRVGDDDLRAFVAQVSPALLPALGAVPLAGRLFTPAEAEEGASRVILLGEALWQERFGREASVIGRVVRVDGQPYTVVGVLPRGFAFPTTDARVWRPYTIGRVSTDPERAQATSGMTAMARLAPGVTAAQVEAEGTSMARSVPVTMATQALFGVGGPPIVHVRPLAADMTGNIRPVLLVLAAAVGSLLLIACANVANIFLTRGLARRREFAVRASIGAGRSRLVRQMLTESFVLSLGGAMLGLLLAWALLRITPALAPARFPRLADIHLDRYALAFTATATILATVLSGLLPALRGIRFNVAASLRGGSGATSEGFHGARDRRLRDALLVAESAFAVMLIIAAMLLVRSFVRLTSVDPGYRSEGVVIARVLMPPGGERNSADRFAVDALSRLRALPGVVSAGAGNMMPMVQAAAIATFPFPDPSGVSAQITARTLSYTVTPGYAETLGIRLRAGRLFDARDAQGGIRAMIVNEPFARKYLGNGPYVGRRFTNLFPRIDKGLVTEIVGVVGPMLREGNDREPEPEIYVAAPARPSPTDPLRSVYVGFGQTVNFAVRTMGDPRAIVPAVRTALRDTDRDAVIDRLQPLADPLAASVAQPRFATATLVAFALLALTLAAVGLYGVLSYAVSQRRRELGVRAALGASRSAVLGLVMREGVAVAAIGVVLGALGATAVTRLMQGALFGVTPLDAMSFLAAPLVLLPVAAVACLVPAWRAARVRPAEALRE